MPHNDQIKNLMSLSYQRITKDANISRKQNAQKRLDYYDGAQRFYLDSDLVTQFKKPDRLKLQKETTNITKAIIDEVAVLYTSSPKREIIDGTKADQELYDEIVKNGQLNIVLDTVNKLTKLCKDVLLRPVVREKEKMEFDIITPNYFDVMQNMSNPTKADAILYSRIIDDSLLMPQLINADDIYRRGNEKVRVDENISRDYLGQVVYYYFDSLNHFAFTGKGEPVAIDGNDKGVNPFGVLPFVLFRDNYPRDRFFDLSGMDLIETNAIINVKLVELNYLTKMQAFSQPVRKGASKDSDFVLDPSVCMDIPADDEQNKNTDFKFVTPDAKIAELAKDIDNKLQRIAQQYKLSPEMFKISGDRSSGFSIQMQNFQLGKQINRDKPYYRTYESELFQLIKIIWNYSNTRQFSVNSKLSVDFVDVGAPQSVEEVDNHNLLLQQNGLQSKAEWLLKINPDLGTVEEAQKRLDAIAVQDGTPNAEEAANALKKELGII